MLDRDELLHSGLNRGLPMIRNRESGFSLIELMLVLLISAAIVYAGVNVFSGWRERNALRTVSEDIKFTFDKYRQKALDKGLNYGLIFSDDGIYAFEDNGGSGSDPFQAVNNFRVDSGEFSDKWRGGAGGNPRFWRRVTDTTGEFSFFAGSNAAGRLYVMTDTAANLMSARSGTPYDTAGTDITSSAVIEHTGGSVAPFEGGSMALFFSPEGYVYLKDPSTAVTPLNKFNYRLGLSGNDYYIVRIAYDDPSTPNPEVPDYFEVAINRYGAATLIRWHTGDGGATWNADIQ